MRIAVITKIPDDKTGGNLALIHLPLLLQTAPNTDSYRDAASLIGPQLFMLRQRVFEVGEILILDDDGREIAGHGRKPSKWDVGVELFDTHELFDAVERAQAAAK